MNIETYLTPYKYNKPVIDQKDTGFSSQGADCPFLFRHNGKFYMMHIGFDGIGYQTALSSSDDLLNWKEEGVILKRGCHADWNKVGMSGNWILKNCDLYGDNELIKYDGKYWLFYHSYPDEGYESGPAKVGAAYTTDENLLEWHFIDEPIFCPSENGEWDSGGLYKVCVIQNEDKFYMFYNAKNITNGGWKEQTGVAISEDLLHWERYDGNPILKIEEDTWTQTFASDPCVAYDSKNDLWVMFFFGFDSKHAREGVAIGKDLLHFEKYEKPIIDVGKEGEIDSVHAHKPGIIYNDGVLYHYYCACDEKRRCITVAASKPF